MNREEAHKLVDQLFDQQIGEVLSPELESEPVLKKPARTDGKRAVRTKSTGDRVYLVDDNAKTKAWITSPDILEKLGFSLNDVEDVEDSILIGYQMNPSIYKVD